jgi:hypothetical protein
LIRRFTEWSVHSSIPPSIVITATLLAARLPGTGWMFEGVAGDALGVCAKDPAERPSSSRAMAASIETMREARRTMGWESHPVFIGEV